MTLLASRPDADHLNAEAIIKEARQRRRRRWIVATIAIIIVGSGPIAYVATSGSGNANGRSKFVTANSKGPQSSAAAATSEMPVMLDSTHIGPIAVGSHGQLYFVDVQNGWIAELTSSGMRAILKVPNDVLHGSPSNLEPGVGGLSVSNSAIWYTANGNLYTASLVGTNVRQVDAAKGATTVQALGNGAVMYSTEGARTPGIYERSPEGKTTLLAGGNSEFVAAGSAVATREADTGVPARSVGMYPIDFAVGPRGVVYIADYTHEQLDLVADGVIRQITSGPGAWHAGMVASGPNGIVYGIGTHDMDRIVGRTITPTFVVPSNINRGYFSGSNVAVSQKGAIYISYFNQTSGAAEQSAIVRYSATGKPTVVLFAGHPCYFSDLEKRSARPFNISAPSISLPATVGCSPKVSTYKVS